MFSHALRQGIRFKFLLIISVILLASTGIISTLISINERGMLRHSLMTKGNGLASYLAKHSKDPLIMKDRIQLDSIVNQAVKDEEILYTVIQDASGNPLTSQFASIDYSWPRVRNIVSGLPKDRRLKDIMAAIKAQGGVIEISTPITSGTETLGKVILGLSEHKIKQQIVKTIIIIVGLNLAVMFIIGAVIFIVSKKLILDPITTLVQATTRFTQGELSTQMEIKATGEVQVLVESFNLMMEDLGKAIVSKENELTERKRAEEALRESEEGYRNLFENANEAIFVAQEGKIVFLNPRTTMLVGYSKEELAAKPFIEIIHPDARDIVIDRHTRRMKGEDLPQTYDFQIIHKDGHLKWVELNVVAINWKGRTATLNFLSDITERKQAEEELRQSKNFLENVLRTTPSAVFTVDSDRKVTSWNLMAERITGYKIEEVLGKTCDILNSATCKEGCRLFDDHFKKPGEYRECVLVRKDGKEITTLKNFDLLSNRAGEVGGGIECFIDITDRRKAEDELKVSLEKLRKVMGGIIQAMALTVETRDPYTSGHQQRVADLARSIGQEMGLSEGQVDGLRMAGIVHDLGKIAVPAEILSKPTKLSTLEFGLIKVHPQISYDILKDIDFPWPVAEIVLQHHERLDGTGYPQGLTGTNILLEARILAVADVVEAIASHRPYRPALGIEKALEEISQNKGVLYDSKAVEVCLKLFREKGYQLN